jgi:flagellar protein FliO/FliZ
MFELLIRIAFSLLVVLGLLWGLARLARRPLGGRGGGVLEVLARQQLSRGSSVAVVRVADRALVVGVSDAGVSLLASADLTQFEQAPRAPAGAGFAEGGARGGLVGSALSPATWRQAAAFIRRRTGTKS